MPENEHLSSGDDISPPDVYYVERDEAYLCELRAEEEHWDTHLGLAECGPVLPELERYQNERLTGDGNRAWHETINDYGEFSTGCVLGAGPGHIESHLLERNPQLHLTIYDISGEALARVMARLEPKFPGRVETRQEDLNFVTLAPDTYDLVFPNSCVHHIVNLEHVAYQVNQSLTSDGYFFMKDTVSESYFQFSKEKKRVYQAFVDATHDDTGRAQPIRWPDRGNWSYSPFESARSDEILEVFARYLREERVRTVGPLLQLGLFGGPSDLQGETALHRRVLRRLIRIAFRAGLVSRRSYIARAKARGELLQLLDSHFSDSGRLKPGVAFAVYRKRAHA